MKKIVITLLIGLFSVSIFAFDVSFYRSAQTLEMGETFTGIANNQNAIFYNPAGIANVKGFFFSLPNFNAGMSQGFGSATLKTISNWNQIQPLIQSGNSTLLMAYLIQNYLPYLQGSNSLLTGSDALIGYGFGNFAIAGGAFGQLWGQSILTQYNTLSLNASADVYAFGTTAFSLNFGDLKLNAGGTYRYGYVFPQIYSINNEFLLAANLNPDLTYVPTSNVDLGTMISYGQLSFGALWHNVLNQSPPDVRVGIGYESKNISAGIDLENIFNENYTLYRKVHAGISYRPFDFLTFYGGLSAGWFTGGIQANLGLFYVNLGTYVLNYGNYAGYNYQRMYAIQIGIANSVW
ncbi:MAG: hypothetical protein C0176_02265 [Mesoaciditoga sp.]|uniref:hypothetical protein n=1 Tax=Athalassotoga sp. TaxID=2022597 RepID=UPI000CAE9C27|nr:MAG: hypothetical protein C0185_02855 [Mesoaciditoga sp.]PMP80490.1 MAG: hypothetical protein C0176_02265 [Mesoaciditoga sp.]